MAGNYWVCSWYAGSKLTHLKAYPLTPTAGASLGYIIGALLTLGMNILLFLVDADRLDS